MTSAYNEIFDQFCNDLVAEWDDIKNARDLRKAISHMSKEYEGQFKGAFKPIRKKGWPALWSSKDNGAPAYFKGYDDFKKHVKEEDKSIPAANIPRMFWNHVLEVVGGDDKLNKWIGKLREDEDLHGVIPDKNPELKAFEIKTTTSKEKKVSGIRAPRKTPSKSSDVAISKNLLESDEE